MPVQILERSPHKRDDTFGKSILAFCGLRRDSEHNRKIKQLQPRNSGDIAWLNFF